MLGDSYQPSEPLECISPINENQFEKSVQQNNQYPNKANQDEGKSRDVYDD